MSQTYREDMKYREVLRGFASVLGRDEIKLPDAGAYWNRIRLEGWEADCPVPITPEFAWQLEQIHAGKLHPAVVLTYERRPYLVRGLAKLSPEDQLAKLKKPLVLVADGDSEATKRIAELTFTEAAAVFGDGRIRTPDEQRAVCGPKVHQRAASRYVPTLAEDGKTWLVNNHPVEHETWKAKEAELAPRLPEPRSDCKASAVLFLHPDTLEMYERLAERKGLELEELVRRAMAKEYAVEFRQMTQMRTARQAALVG